MIVALTGATNFVKRGLEENDNDVNTVQPAKPTIASPVRLLFDPSIVLRFIHGVRSIVVSVQKLKSRFTNAVSPVSVKEVIPGF